MRILINAGHSSDDPGAGTKFGNLTESEFAMIVRDIILKKLPNAIYIPDNLDLKQSIDFVNSYKLESDDLAVSIHFNSNNNNNISGIETYYYKDSFIATIFANSLAKFTKMVNRGAKHDSETYVGMLGWLRKVNCNSVLLECGYLSNIDDFKKISLPSFQEKIADGIIDGIQEYKLHISEVGNLKKMIATLERLVEILKNNLKKKQNDN